MVFDLSAMIKNVLDSLIRMITTTEKNIYGVLPLKLEENKFIFAPC
jgi:hypothetical protein